MKKRIISTLIAFLTIVSLGLSQEVKMKAGDHFPDPDCKKFAGIWLWKNRNNSFKLILRFEKVTYHMFDNITNDIIVGFHKFVKENRIVEDSTPYKLTAFKDNKSSLLGGTDSNNRNHLTGSIIHLSKDKSVKFDIEYIDSNHIKLVKVTNTPGVKISTPGKPYDSSISLPQNIILIRQK